MTAPKRMLMFWLNSILLWHSEISKLQIESKYKSRSIFLLCKTWLLQMVSEQLNIQSRSTARLTAQSPILLEMCCQTQEGLTQTESFWIAVLTHRICVFLFGFNPVKNSSSLLCWFSTVLYEEQAKYNDAAISNRHNASTKNAATSDAILNPP